MGPKEGQLHVPMFLYTHHDSLVGAEVNWPDGSNNGFLKAAAEAGHHFIIRHLVASKCTVNVYGSGQATPLHHAARYGHAQCVADLLAAGANPDLKDSQGQTSLITAAKNCHSTMSVMKVLIEAKCDMNIQDKGGKTALHYCCHKAIGAQQLLRAGANPDIQVS